MLNRGDCPICGDVIVGDHKWEYLCRNCSLKFKFDIKGTYIISSDNINDTIFKDVVHAVLACKHIEIVIIREDEDDNSEILREFIKENGINNCSMSIVNNAPQIATTAYLVYEACPTAHVIFGEKNDIFNLMIEKHHMIAWDDPSMEEVNNKVEEYLSKCCS